MCVASTQGVYAASQMEHYEESRTPILSARCSQNSSQPMEYSTASYMVSTLFSCWLCQSGLPAADNTKQLLHARGLHRCDEFRKMLPAGQPLPWPALQSPLEAWSSCCILHASRGGVFIQTEELY